MELAVSTGAHKGKGGRGARYRGFQPPSSWGVSGRVGVRFLMHRNLLTCRLLGLLPRSWLQHCYGRGSDPHSSSSCSLLSRLPSALRDRHQRPPPSLAAPPQEPDGWQCAPGMTLTPPAPSAHSASLTNSSSDAQAFPGLSFRPSYTHSSGSVPAVLSLSLSLSLSLCLSLSLGFPSSFLASPPCVPSSFYPSLCAFLFLPLSHPCCLFVCVSMQACMFEHMCDQAVLVL